jgi:hypothetical protein
MKGRDGGGEHSAKIKSRSFLAPERSSNVPELTILMSWKVQEIPEGHDLMQT